MVGEGGDGHPSVQENRTTVLRTSLILDGEAEYISGGKACGLVHSSVEQRVGIGVPNVEYFASLYNVTGYAFCSGDPNLLRYKDASHECNFTISRNEYIFDSEMAE